MADSIAIWKLEDCKKYLPAPKAIDHKYKRGVLCCVTGSKEYPGAALLTTSSAIATGVGMVRFRGAKSVRKAVIQNKPAVVIRDGKCDALLLGSGIPYELSLRNLPNLFRLKRANQITVPKVLDAGALHLSRKVNAPTIITPHAGELAKLMGLNITNIEADPIGAAQDAARKFNITVLLKGHQTVVANADRAIKLPAATSWLATAGTGDVLAGILGALIAINKDKVNDDNLIEIGATASLIHAESAITSSRGPIDLIKMIETISAIVTQITE